MNEWKLIIIPEILIQNMIPFLLLQIQALPFSAGAQPKCFQIFNTCQSQADQTIFNFNSDVDFHRNYHLH